VKDSHAVHVNCRGNDVIFCEHGAGTRQQENEGAAAALLMARLNVFAESADLEVQERVCPE
jgi:hypothetical protein